MCKFQDILIAISTRAMLACKMIREQQPDESACRFHGLSFCLAYRNSASQTS